MKSSFIIAMVALAAALTATGQPVIGSGGILNNASFALPGTPNSSIAQGSLFAVFASNLGVSGVTTQPRYPLQTTLAGISGRVTSGGQTFDLIPAYVTAAQVGFVLPSRTPVGNGTVTITANGQTSAPAPITIVANSFGTYAVNSAGSGAGIITNTNFQILGLASAAQAGETIIIWGTGLGAVTGDEIAAPAQQVDLTSLSVQVYVGGRQATVLYRGRSSCCTALDVIYVTVPAGVEGCNVPVVVVVNGVPSNTTTMPVASGSGRTCSDPNGLSNTDLQTLLDKGTFSLGFLNISRSTTTTPGITVGPITLPGQTTQDESAFGTFARYNAAAYAANINQFSSTSFGSCIVNIFRASGIPAPIGVTFLDAGPSINLTGPSGSRQLMKQQGLYFATLNTGNQSFIPAAGGTFTFNNASGGADVGGFNVPVDVGVPLVWTNMDQIPTNIPRSQGLTVNWSGGAQNSYVVISGSSVVTNPTLVGIFTCTERVGAGTFTVPSYVLSQLPSSSGTSVGGVTIPNGSLSVGNSSNPVKFTAPGLDQAYASWSTTSGKSVNYQ